MIFKEKERTKVVVFEKIPYKLIWDKYFKDCKNVLDAGCGDGAFVEIYPERGIGLDIAKSDFWDTNKGRYKIGDLYKLPFKPETLDGIFCSHVFEHLLDIRSVLKQFYKVLKPGGKLVILMPSHWLLYVPFSKYNFYNEISHIRPLTSYGLKYGLESEGFKMKKLKYNQFYFPGVRWLTRKLNLPGLYEMIAKRISLRFPPFELFCYAEKK